MTSHGRRVIAVIVAATTMLSAAGCSSDRQLAGAQIDPPPDVSAIELPELTADDQMAHLMPVDSDLLLVYFGYTSCPDFCPRTMADLASAVQRLDDPTRVSAAMVTIDPARDLDHLDTYVRAFFDNGRAFGTDDPAALTAAANAFGVTYSVTTEPGSEPVVSHTTSAYVVDRDGRLILTWPYGTTVSDIELDLKQLLDGTR